MQNNLQETTLRTYFLGWMCSDKNSRSEKNSERVLCKILPPAEPEGGFVFSFLLSLLYESLRDLNFLEASFPEQNIKQSQWILQQA